MLVYFSFLFTKIRQKRSNQFKPLHANEKPEHS